MFLLLLLSEVYPHLASLPAKPIVLQNHFKVNTLKHLQSKAKWQLKLKMLPQNGTLFKVTTKNPNRTKHKIVRNGNADNKEHYKSLVHSA
jgi:hypothetical protein